jgi:hypothetical protein
VTDGVSVSTDVGVVRTSRIAAERPSGASTVGVSTVPQKGEWSVDRGP